MFPPFYHQVLALNAQQHGNWSLSRSKDVSYAAQANAIHLQAREFRGALLSFPIVFVGTPEKINPAVLTGVVAQRDLFISKDGMW